MMLLNDFLWRNLRLSFGMFGRLVVSLIIDDYNIVDYKGFFCCCGCCILLLLLLLLSMIINFNSVQKIPLAMYNERFVYIHFDFILLFAICCCFAGLLLIMMMAMTMLLMMKQHLWMFCSVQFSSVPVTVFDWLLLHRCHLYVRQQSLPLSKSSDIVKMMAKMLKMANNDGQK